MDQAEYLTGYLTGVGIVESRIYYAQFEPHYHRGFVAGVVGLFFGVDLSGGAL